jgi:hypothetical protein
MQVLHGLPLEDPRALTGREKRDLQAEVLAKSPEWAARQQPVV